MIHLLFSNDPQEHLIYYFDCWMKKNISHCYFLTNLAGQFPQLICNVYELSINSMFIFFFLMRRSRCKRYNLIVSSCDNEKGMLPTTVGKETPNLFQKQIAERTKVIRIDQQRLFDYVGIKLLNDYYERVHRMSKQKKRESFLHNYSQSRISSHRGMLSKQQVLAQIKKNSTYDPSGVARIRSQNSSILLEGLNESLHTNNSQVSEYRQRGNVSIHRVKLKHKSYADLWKQAEERSGDMKGFPSVLKTANEQRQKNILRKNKEAKFMSQNINSRMWETVLRDTCELKNVYKKRIYRESILCKKSLVLMGRSKFKEESDWLGVKENLGYRFTFHKDQTQAQSL